MTTEKTVVTTPDLGNTLYVDSSSKVNVNIDNATIIVKNGALHAVQSPVNTDSFKLNIVPAKRSYAPGEAQLYTITVTNASASEIEHVVGNVVITATNAQTETVLPSVLVVKPDDITSQYVYQQTETEGTIYTFGQENVQPNGQITFQLRVNAEEGLVRVLLNVRGYDSSSRLVSPQTAFLHMPLYTE